MPQSIRRFVDYPDEFAEVGGRGAEQMGLAADGAPKKHLQVSADALRRQSLMGFGEID
jgi:hypothetical protein